MSQLLSGLAAVSLQSILADLPHRPVDLFVYAFLLVSVAVFWRVGRSRPDMGDGAETDSRPE